MKTIIILSAALIGTAMVIAQFARPTITSWREMLSSLSITIAGVALPFIAWMVVS
jgi:hypothetical protein